MFVLFPIMLVSKLALGAVIYFKGHIEELAQELLQEKLDRKLKYEDQE